MNSSIDEQHAALVSPHSVRRHKRGMLNVIDRVGWVQACRVNRDVRRLGGSVFHSTTDGISIRRQRVSVWGGDVVAEF